MCTGLRLTCADGTTVHGRTVEFAVPLEMEVVHVPAGTQFTSSWAGGQGASWTTRHAALGVACYGADAVIDGFNDVGLSAGAFYFPGWAEYTDPSAANAGSLTPADFVHWVLTTCATTEELRATVEAVNIVGVEVAGWGGVPPFHFVAYDRDGTSVAVEPRGGRLVVSDNPYGSFSNAPEIGFHLTNLAQFMEVGTKTVTTATLGGTSLTTFGAGSGGLGLPGDFTPPSRFVRATYFSVNHPPPPTSQDGIHEVFHLLNQFDIPRGFVMVDAGDSDVEEWTLATAARDPARGEYYVRTYGDQRITKVAMSQVPDRDRITRTAIGPITGAHTPVDDITGRLAAVDPATSRSS